MTDMTISQVQERVDALSNAMLAKGLREPVAKVSFESHGVPYAFIKWKDARSTRYGGDEFKSFCVGTLPESFDEADAFVAALPSPEEARLHEFMGALGKVIDLGRETGIDVEFVNPLVAQMKKLSENALTYRREAAE